MNSRKFLLAVTATASLACAVVLPPLMMSGEAFGQTNPTMANVVPEGGNYAVQGKIEALDPGAMTLTLRTEKAGSIPMTVSPGVDLSNVSVGDVASVHYTRAVTFVVGSPQAPAPDVRASATVGEIARTPGGFGPNAATVAGRVTKIDGPSSFDVVNANGGGVYTINVTNPARQAAVKLLKVGDSVTVSVSPLIVTSIAKCGVFGFGVLGC